MTDIRYDNPNALLAAVLDDHANLTGSSNGIGGPSTGGGVGSPGNDGPMFEGLLDMLDEISDLVQRIVDMVRDSVESGGNDGGGSISDPVDIGEVISGSGRIWGDPHFIGQDGGKYDVQGKAGTSYNLLSDANFQMNGRFDQYKNTNGLTVVGQVGIAAGSDQIEVNKDGTVLVNGEALEAGDRVALEDGGFVEVASNGSNVQINSGEWETNIQFRNKGNGPTSHLNIDVSTENAVADGVRPHGLLGQTFDADNDARNGDRGKGTQGGGAIEGLDGEITDRGDRSSVELYEVDNVHDRNFTNFNNFFDEADSNPRFRDYASDVMGIIQNALRYVRNVVDDFDLVG